MSGYRRHIMLDVFIGKEVVAEIRDHGIVSGVMSYEAGFYHIKDLKTGKDVGFRKTYVGAWRNRNHMHIVEKKDYHDGLFEETWERKTSLEERKKKEAWRRAHGIRPRAEIEAERKAKKIQDREAELRRRGII